MAIITISRGTFAGGEKLESLLAQHLGYRTVSREEVYDRVQAQYGFKAEELAELMEQAPTTRLTNVGERRSRQTLGERRRQLMVAVQASLCDLLKADDVVYHGLAGHLLLPGIAHVLRMRVIAPRSKRIELAMEREGLTRPEAGRKIDQVDSERARWTQSFFGVNWGDPLLFDVVLNLDSLTFDDVCAVVEHMVSLPRFQTTESSRKKMADLALASHVTARLSCNPATAGLLFDVQADDGVVRVGGMSNKGDMEWVSKVLQKIEGVKLVEVI